MIRSEQAFDMLPYVVDIYDKLEIDKYRKELAQKTKGEKIDVESLGIEAFKYVIKNSGKVKEEFFNIVAIAEEKTPEEIKSQPFLKTMAKFKEVFTDKELTDFFKQAMQ
jgi:hypothetical protein